MKARILLSMVFILSCVFSQAQIGVYTLVGSGDTLLIDLENVVFIRENTDSTGTVFAKEFEGQGQFERRYIINEKIDSVITQSGNNLFLITESQTSRRYAVYKHHPNSFQKNSSGSLYFRTDTPFRRFDINEGIDYIKSKLEAKNQVATDTDWKVETTGANPVDADPIQHTGPVVVGGTARTSTDKFEVIGSSKLRILHDTIQSFIEVKTSTSLGQPGVLVGSANAALDTVAYMQVSAEDASNGGKPTATLRALDGVSPAWGMFFADLGQAQMVWSNGGTTSKIVANANMTITTDSISAYSPKVAFPLLTTPDVGDVLSATSTSGQVDFSGPIVAVFELSGDVTLNAADTIKWDSIPVITNINYIDTTGVSTDGEIDLMNGFFSVRLEVLPVSGSAQSVDYQIFVGGAGVRPTTQAVEGTGTNGFSTPLEVIIDATGSTQIIQANSTTITGTGSIESERTNLIIKRLR